MVLVVDQEDVVGFEVAVNDAALVRRGEAAQHLRDDVHGHREGELTALCQDLTQGLAVQEFHDHEQQALGGAAQVEHVDDVRVPDGAGRTRLAFEAAGQLGVAAELLTQGFDGHAAVQGHVQASIDDAHGTPAQLADDLVLPVQDLAGVESG